MSIGGKETNEGGYHPMSCNCSDNNAVNPAGGCAENLYENEYRAAYENCPSEQTENTRTQCASAAADLENLGAVTDVSLVRKGLKIFTVVNRNAASVEYEARITYLTTCGVRKLATLPLSALFFLPCNYDCDSFRFRADQVSVNVESLPEVTSVAVSGCSCGSGTCCGGSCVVSTRRVTVHAAITLRFNTLV